MMKTTLLIIVTIEVLFCFQGTLGLTVDPTLFTCEPFDGYPVECVGILGDTGLNVSVYVSAAQGLTQEVWASQFYTETPSGSIFSLLPALSPQCAQLYLRLWCPTFLQPCSYVGPPVNLAVPHPPCQEVCQEFNYECAVGSVPAMDCSTVNPLTGGPLWPNSTYNIINQLPSCSEVPVDELGPLDVICPPNSVFYPAGDPKVPPPRPVCALPCSDFLTIPPGYQQGYLQAGFIQLSVLAAISMACVVIMLVTFSIFPPLREWPRRIVLFMSIGVFIEMLGWVGNITFDNMANLTCKNEVALQGFEGWCSFQAWTSLFGSLVVLMWWTTQAFVLFWNVGLMRDPKQLAKFEPLFHLINWPFPLACSLVFVGTTNFGPLPGYPYCFIFNDAPLALQWIFFYTPLVVAVFLVTIFLAVTMIRLCKESTLKSTFWDRWKYQLQLGTFAFYFLLTIVYVVAFRVWAIEDHGDQTTKGNFQYIYQCVLVEEGGDSCETPFPLNHYLFFSQIILFGIQGIMLMILFLIMNEYNRNLFVLACRNLKEGRSIFYLPQGGSSTGTSGGSSGSSSDDPSRKQRRSNRKLRRKMAAEAPEV